MKYCFAGVEIASSESSNLLKALFAVRMVLRSAGELVKTALMKGVFDVDDIEGVEGEDEDGLMIYRSTFVG